MSIGNNIVDQIASKHLGQKGGEGYSDQYDPSLLVFIPRTFNREIYGIQENNLPFVGYDTWNAYEVSAITNNGLPVAGMLKISYPVNSRNHVESKSLKLYLNSFNMTKLGRTQDEVILNIKSLVKRDLESGIGEEVNVSMFTEQRPFNVGTFYGYPTLEFLLEGLEDIEFDSSKSNKSLLKIAKYSEFTKPEVYRYSTHLLRSNCRVTNQPDWGSVYIYMESSNQLSEESLLQYIVSHRKVNHFHEEVCEMIYVDLMDVVRPEKLMVACLYTRRGGIDINPIRASHAELIPVWFNSNNVLIKKTLRQ